MKKSLRLAIIGVLALTAGISLANNSYTAGIKEDTKDAYENIGVSLRKANIGASETVDVSRTFVQYGSEGTRNFVRFATAISGPVKSIKYVRTVAGLDTKEKEVTTVYKGIQAAGGVYYYNGSEVVTTASELTDNYYWACYTIEFTSDTYKAADITAHIVVETEASDEVIESTPRTESFNDLKAEADKTLYIHTVEELKAFRDEVNAGSNYAGKTVVLTSDLDLANENWTPIGATSAKSFQGTFDGNGHTITNMSAINDLAYGNGFFGNVVGGSVRNVTFTNAYVARDNDVTRYSGNVYGIVTGYSYGKCSYENITIKDSLIRAFGKVGGVIGMGADPGDYTTLSNIKLVNTNIHGGYNCGGIVGLEQGKFKINNCDVSGATFTGCETIEELDAIGVGYTDGAEKNIKGRYWFYGGYYYYAAYGDYLTYFEDQFYFFGEDVYTKEACLDIYKGNLVSTFQELKEALNDDKEIRLANDIVFEEMLTIPADKNVVIDLNGKTIDVVYNNGSTTNHIYAFTNNGNLKLNGNGTINARGIFNYGTMEVNGVTINAIDGNGGYGVRNYDGAKLILNRGTIATTLEDDNKVDKGGYDATTVRVDAGATFVMNGGLLNNICDYTFAIDNYGSTIVNGGNVKSVHSTISSYGTLEINGGNFVDNGLEGVTAHVIVAWDNSVTNINGGTFDGKDNYNGFNIDACAGAVVNVYGGEFLSVHSGSLYGEGTINVYGGTFFDNPSKRLAYGYVASQNDEGNWVVSAAPTATNYAELKELLKTEKSILIDGMITLEDNLSASDVTLYAVKENCGIDFNSYNIGGSGTIKYENLLLKTKTKSVSSSDIPANSWYGGIDYHGHSTATYVNCTIEGVFTSYSDVINAEGCTFNSYVENGEEYYNIFAYSAGTINLNKCTFMYRDRAIKVYSEGAGNFEVNITDCSFVATEDYSINKALINIDDTYFTSCVVNIKNISIDEKLASAKLYSYNNASKVTINQL